MDIRNCYSEESPPAYNDVINSDQLPQYDDAIGNVTYQSPSNYTTFVIEDSSRPSSNVNEILYSMRTCLSQFTSVLGGFTLFLISGLHIGWGIWRLEFTDHWIEIGVSHYRLFIFIVMSWYVGALVGGIIGAVVVTHVRKKVIYCTCGTILAISSIIFIIWNSHQVPILIARILAGVGHGIVYNVAITHAAENADKEIRPQLLSIVNIMIATGIFISATVIGLLYDRDHVFISYRVIGIIGLVTSLIGIVFTMLLTIESVYFELRRTMDTEASTTAVTILLKVRPIAVSPSNIIHELRDLETTIAEHLEKNQNIFTNGNALPIFYMIFSRIATNVTNNILLNVTMMNILVEVLGNNYELAPIILTFTRFIVTITSLFTMAIYKRRRILTSICTPIILLIFVIVMDDGMELPPAVYILGIVLCILFQSFVGLGMDPMQHVQLSEVFATSKKAWSIAFVTGFENIFQMSMIGLFFIVNEVSFAVMTISLAVTLGYIFFFAFIPWPRTSKKSLRETANVLKSHIYCVTCLNDCRGRPA